MNRQRGLTLIELTVAGAVTALLGTVLAATLSQTAEQARSAKCQRNLKQVIHAVGMYALDNAGYLPGPLHPAILRGVHDFHNPEQPTSDIDKRKSLTWLLRPYFQAVGDSVTNPSTPNPIVDELFRCPTASMISPDEDFHDDTWISRHPYNYALNSYGPNTCPTIFTQGEWYHTDPPMYFGCWYYLDPWPETPGLTWDTYRQRAWKPKLLSRIKLPAAEWAIADAWYRRITSGGSRGGPRPRQYLGSFPLPHSANPLPSAPLHGVPPRMARSTRDSGSSVLPKIMFDGWTNQAHFDGHVSAFEGRWRYLGEGGTVNPYWWSWGGEHRDWECPY